MSSAETNEDTTTDLYDAQFREYGIQGRWPSPDPAGLAAVNPANPQSWNRYAYVLNNPLAFVDPTGLRMNCRNANTPSCRIANGGDGSFLPGCVLDGIATDCSFIGVLFNSGDLGACVTGYSPQPLCGTLSDPGISGSSYVDIPYTHQGAPAEVNCFDTGAVPCLTTVGASITAELEIEINFFNSVFPYGIPEADVDGRAGGAPLFRAAVRGVQAARPIANPCVIAGFYLASATGGATLNAPSLFAETKSLVASIPTSAITSSQSWLYRQAMTGAAGTYTLFKLASAGLGKVASACNAVE